MASIQELKTISNIRHSNDGEDFLKFLEDLSKRNYEEFKKTTSEMNDICKGTARTLDMLIKLFNTCDDNINKIDASHQSGEAIF